MFDQVMWIAYLSIGVACGLLGVLAWQFATRDEPTTAPLKLTGTILLAVGAFCAWLSPVVGLPGHTTQIVILTAVIAVGTTLTVLVVQRAVLNKRVRMNAALQRGR